MTINEMIKNAKTVIPVLEVTLSMSVDELNKAVRNAMFERFVSEVVTDSVLCGISAPNSRIFAVDFIQNNDYVQKCITATINLVLSGAFSEKQQLDSFINRLLWSHVVVASHIMLSHEKATTPRSVITFRSLKPSERRELEKQAMKQTMMNWNE